MGQLMIASAIAGAFVLAAVAPARTETSADSGKVVRTFVESWGKASVDETVAYLADDVLFVNIPIPEPIKGRAKAKEFLDPFFRKDPLVVPFQFRTEIKLIVSQGPNVMLERVDSFDIAGKQWTIPVVGVFEVKNGKIAVWKDYFDMGQFQAPATLIETLKKKK